MIPSGLLSALMFARRSITRFFPKAAQTYAFLKDSMETIETKVCIIGSGPAAHTAAIYAARAELHPIAFEGWMANGIAAGAPHAPPLVKFHGTHVLHVLFCVSRLRGPVEFAERRRAGVRSCERSIRPAHCNLLRVAECEAENAKALGPRSGASAFKSEQRASRGRCFYQPLSYPGI